MNNISIRKAAFINFFARYSNVFVQLIINSILARILTPSDYGIVAVISVFISFFAILADLGIGPAVIQNKDLTKKDISNIFIFTIGVAIVTVIGFCLFSYPLSYFYNNDIYVQLGCILSVGIFFNVLNMVPNALLLKDKQFIKLGSRTVIINIMGGILTAYLAIKGAGYYALVINMIFVAFVTFVWNFHTCKLKIFFAYSNSSIKKIRQYSSFQFGFSIVNYFSRNLDNLLIGKFLGQSPLGYYDKAYKLMMYPVQNLTYVISPVLHPILSEYQKDHEKIYMQYFKIVKILSLLGIFFSVYCFFSAREIILIMFGDQWVLSIKAFEVLSLSIWPQVITSSSGAIFQSTGDTKYLFKTGIQSTICIVTSIIIGISLGSIETVAILVTIAYLINFFIAFRMLIVKVFNKSLFQFIFSLKEHLLILAIMIVGLFLINVSHEHVLISATLKLIVSIVLFIVGLIITKEYKTLLKIIKK